MLVRGRIKTESRLLRNSVPLAAYSNSLFVFVYFFELRVHNLLIGLGAVGAFTASGSGSGCRGGRGFLIHLFGELVRGSRQRLSGRLDRLRIVAVHRLFQRGDGFL